MLGIKALRRQIGAGRCHHFTELAVNIAGIAIAETGSMVTAVIMADISDNGTKRTEQGGDARHDNPRYAKALGDAGCVRTTATTTAYESEIAQIMALFSRNLAHRVGHVLVHQGVDRVGGFQAIDAQRLGNCAADAIAGQIAVDGHGPAQKLAVREIAQGDVGIGHRRRLSATAITGGTGPGLRALRAHLQQAAVIDPGDGAAARA